MKFFKRFGFYNRLVKGKLKTEDTDAMKEFVKKYADIVRQELTNQPMTLQQWNGTPMDDNYMFNFNQNFVGTVGTGFANPMDAQAVDGGGDPTSVKIIKEIRKPIDVLMELERVPNAYSLENLDDKIAILNDKRDFINKHTPTHRELSSLIERLENRKKYKDHHAFFSQFQQTDMGKINALLSKYSLVLKPAEIFIPEFPAEAVKIMKEYSRIVKEISGKDAVYEVIAPQNLFAQKYKERDPILLVQSPFAFIYDILGAWDKEMILLNEL